MCSRDLRWFRRVVVPLGAFALLAAGFLAGVTYQTTWRDEQDTLLARRVDVRRGSLLLVVEHHRARRAFGVGHYVVLLQEEGTGRSVPLLTLQGSFQEASPEPRLISVARDTVTYESAYGRFLVDLPALTTFFDRSAQSARDGYITEHIPSRGRGAHEVEGLTTRDASGAGRHDDPAPATHPSRSP